MSPSETERAAVQPAAGRASFRVDGKVAWVTGAGRGLGRAIALGLAEAGARVALMARTEAEILAVKGEIEATGGEAIALAGSVTSSGDVRATVAEIERAWGGLDVLVNNAGVSPTFKRSELLEDAEWREILEINLSGVFYCCRAAARVMIEAGGGSIVNVSSVHGSVAAERLAAYAASKGGIDALTRTLAVEWADRGVRVNAVAPGYLETEMTAGLRSGRRRQSLLDRIPVGRFGLPEQVVPAVLFLAGDASEYVTGATLFVDGGWTAQ